MKVASILFTFCVLWGLQISSAKDPEDSWTAFSDDELEKSKSFSDTNTDGLMSLARTILWNHWNDGNSTTYFPGMHSFREPVQVYSSVVIALHIILLSSLILFTLMGSMAFACSFINCRQLVHGISRADFSPRPAHGGFGFPAHGVHRHLENRNWSTFEPVAHALQASFKKFDHPHHHPIF